MDEIKNFLIEQERFDLLAIFMTCFDDVDDEDYQIPEQVPPEPYEEYIEGPISEDDLDVGKTHLSVLQVG